MKEVSSMTAVSLGGNFHGSLIDMVVNAGFVVQLVLLLLLLFSVISWAIILMKYFNIRKVCRENGLFLSAYMKSTKLSEIFPEAKKYHYSTLAEVFRAGYTELAKITRAARGNPPGKDVSEAAGQVVEIAEMADAEHLAGDLVEADHPDYLPGPIDIAALAAARCICTQRLPFLCERLYTTDEVAGRGTLPAQVHLHLRVLLREYVVLPVLPGTGMTG